MWDNQRENIDPMTQNYSAENIQVLEGLEAVRKRPGMYIGSTDVRGLHHLLWEIVDNAIDEAMAGFCTDIDITLLGDGGVRVLDNGRGIPVDVHTKTGKSALETVMTILHAGGKFGGGGYKVSGGLHGVGASVVNALSEKVVAKVFRDGKIHQQEYARGAILADVAVVGECGKTTGTEITFYPDPQIFKETQTLEWETILTRIRQQAYLTKGIQISLSDEISGKKYRFYFEGGVASYVAHLSEGKTPISEVISVERETPDCILEVAMRYTDAYTENIWCFTNHIHNPEGGTHLTGFRTALTRTINSYARAKEILKEKDENLTAEDVREGLTAVISIKVAEPQFEGQTKGKLGNSEVRPAVDAAFAEAFTQYLEENPNEARSIIGKCLLAARARKAARAARDTVIRKGALEGMTLPGKLADCSSKNPQECEIFIVEGDSAGGSAKQGRNRHFQAILPLRGKILNVEQARLDRMLANNEVKALIIALGTGIGEVFEVERLRYGKVVIMTDADVDGAHIRTLLLTLFYRYFRDLVDNGHIYIACPPLYKIAKGKVIRYAFDEAEKVKVLGEFGVETGEFYVKIGEKKFKDFEEYIRLSEKYSDLLTKDKKDLFQKYFEEDKILSHIKKFPTITEFNINQKDFIQERLKKDDKMVVDEKNNKIKVIYWSEAPDLNKGEDDTFVDFIEFYQKINKAFDGEKDGEIFVFKGGKSVGEFSSFFDFIKTASQYGGVRLGVVEDGISDEETPEEDALKKVGGVSLQRYKGLGEMNPDQLWETTMDPASRTLLQVTIEDAEKADLVFSTLMGSEVPPRKKFIQTHAKSVKNLDI